MVGFVIRFIQHFVCRSNFFTLKIILNWVTLDIAVMSQSNSPPPLSFDDIIVWGNCQGLTLMFLILLLSFFLSVTISSKMTQLSLFEMGGSQAFLSKDWRMTLTPTLTCTHPERHNKKLRWASCPILWSVTGHSVKQSLEKQAMWVQIAQRTLVQNKEPKKLDYLGLKVKNGRWMTSLELCPFGGKCVYVSETFADCLPYSTFSQREARFCQTVTK